ncbi:hypothetical protein HETIRDRAFT_119819 [Heterobasidion irregulare TC 32-1]|uniref:Uncharacterized protein n=1 Tax=Heterobasidion irregulare (strain TC 32-1) TaxID=747525 RepID=W4JXV9_HETIT|nr:uncharacterized protein HETIRDRAFT_119819 [Heterobasidion irregulare TC 32-1]ETW77721.1 hypothetical protein HETIRDRAFT_119819 [Heterobasidion irregulare TC 32-1]
MSILVLEQADAVHLTRAKWPGSGKFIDRFHDKPSTRLDVGRWTVWAVGNVLHGGSGVKVYKRDSRIAGGLILSKAPQRDSRLKLRASPVSNVMAMTLAALESPSGRPHSTKWLDRPIFLATRFRSNAVAAAARGLGNTYGANQFDAQSVRMTWPEALEFMIRLELAAEILLTNRVINLHVIEYRDCSFVPRGKDFIDYILLVRVQQKRDAQGEPETLQWIVHDLIRVENQIEEVSGSAGRASRKAKYPDPCIPRSRALRIDDQWSEQKDVLIGAP